ncbi:colony stimulating factor 3 (granulocyte) a isoform X2 [Engraulis encrasicolus]|uniref:colony stimulating factor 3 (granulocyte) a isoform X2 n=1 Tax=Engraulis encrasicolus TaxID=184585 RepID=UPI002FD2C26C
MNGVEVAMTEGMTLDPAEGSVNLEYMEALLEIPSAPKLQPLAPDFTLETCLNHMSAGLRLYSGLLQVVGARLSSPLPLSQLHADIKDLKAQVHKIQELSRVSSVEAQMDVSGVSSHLTGDYEVQLAAHVVLSHLRSFTQDTYRSLRNIAQTTVA